MLLCPNMHLLSLYCKPAGCSAVCLFFMLLLLPCIPLSHALASTSDQPGPSSVDTIRISILSKSMKELKEQSVGALTFTFPEHTSLFDKTGGEVTPLREMKMAWHEGQIQIRCDRNPYAPLRRFVVKSSAPNAVFHVQTGRDRRTYPLPLDALESNGEFSLIVEENKLRYALDSAAAEYGAVPGSGQEAVHALGLLILSRVEILPPVSSHTAFHFCDLAHCQIYTGRRNIEKVNTPWRIDERKLQGPLHFHARCGGRTLGGRVFGAAPGAEAGVIDSLSQRGIYLCGRNAYEWEKFISAGELHGIICSSHQTFGARKTSLHYDKDHFTIHVTCGETRLSMAPETFRLKINRVRGWNFLPGNYYDVHRRESAGNTGYVFKGKGLGHGAGLCQTGALKLAALGYSRYDILRHYFPDIQFKTASTMEVSVSPNVSYAVFSLKSGEIEQASHPPFIFRQIPSGSIFKLIVSLYLAARQPSLLTGYTFHCPDGADDDMPAQCWRPGGHGHTGFKKALSHSCNLYFGSLHRHIPRDNFYAFFNQLRRSADITATLPDIQTNREFSHLLIGLDHRVLFSIQDMIKLTQIVSPVAADTLPTVSGKSIITAEHKSMISEALQQTMKEGTGSFPAGRTSGVCKTIWGKTATVSDGTNRPVLCGIFIGGCDEKGIILVRENAVGRDAARSALEVFSALDKKIAHPSP